MTSENISQLMDLVRKAGAAIMAFHGENPGVEIKGDGSPLSEADLAAHRILDAGLRAMFPEIPVVSESTLR